MNPFKIGDICFLEDISGWPLGGQSSYLKHIGEVFATYSCNVGDERVMLKYLDGYTSGRIKIHRVKKIE